MSYNDYEERLARTVLCHKGAVCETHEDRYGETRTGWWLDGMWLAPANDPRAALDAIEGR